MVELIIDMKKQFGQSQSTSGCCLMSSKLLLTFIMQSRLKPMYLTVNIMFGMLCLICSVCQISYSRGERYDFINERRESLSGTIMSILRKSSPRSVEILLHTTSDSIPYDFVCESILKEFPTKVLKFEDQTASEIPPRMRVYEDLVVLYLYTGYQCHNHEERHAVVEKMRLLHWWYLRVKLLFVISTTIECNTLKYLFEEFDNDKVFLNFAITSTNNVVTYHEYDPFENSYKTTNTWNNSDILQIYRRLDMFGQEIRASTVNDPPLTLVRRDNKTGEVLSVRGIGHEIMKGVCKMLNATYVINVRPDHQLGLWLRNGTITGIYKDIMTGKADINPHGLHMFDYGEQSDKVEFVGAVYYDEVWALVPKTKNQSVQELQGLISVLYIMVSLTATIWFVAYMLGFESPMRDPLILFAILIGYSSPHVPATCPQRILLCVWILSTVFLSADFQTSLSHSMSFKKVPSNIETLEELEASGRNVVMFSGVIDIAYASVEDKGSYMNRLRNRTFPGPYRDLCAKLLLDSWSANGSCAPGTFQANAYIHTMLQDGHQALAITKERFFGSWQSFLVRRGTPWLPHINAYILSLQASGLIGKWLSYATIDRKEPNSTLTFSSLKMHTFHSALIVFVSGYFLATLTFCFEYVYYHRRKHVIPCFRSVFRRRN